MSPRSHEWSFSFLRGSSPLPSALAPPPYPGRPPSTVADLASCEQAYGAWVEKSESLNDPGADIAEVLLESETIQGQVFELCRLPEAEHWNKQIPIEYAPGIKRPMIEPDFRTFAELECVEESPLLDGTALCGEVGR